MTKTTSKIRPGAIILSGLFILLLGFMVWQFSGVLPPRYSETSPDTPTSAATLVEETTKVSPEQEAVKIVAFGDSLTAGFGLPLAEAYPAQLEALLTEKGYAVEIINAGVSGETTAGGLRRADFVAKQNPDIVIVALGGNDVLRGFDPKATEESLGQIIGIFQEAGAEVILAGMYAPANLGQSYKEEFNALYSALAEEFKVPLIPFLLEGVALDASLNQADGIHPNKEGAKQIAENNVLPVLELTLEEIEGGTSSN